MAFFITFEGIEGCGKTTQIKRVTEQLTTRGFDIVLTREPGGCRISDHIRAILLDSDNYCMAPTTELLLYAAARAQHMAEVIAPALEAGSVVLCDRFTDATIAYQGHGRGLDLGLIDQLNQLATATVSPDLTILLDCPVEIGLERALSRISASTGAREERFELESRQFHQRVRDGYLQLAAAEPGRFVIIDGRQGIEETAAAIGSAILARLTQR